jgi:hypothetical protein
MMMFNAILELFARTAAKIVKPKPVSCVQDYHLVFDPESGKYIKDYRPYKEIYADRKILILFDIPENEIKSNENCCKSELK